MKETFIDSPTGYVIKKEIDGKVQDLYTHSYLGYGLMSARKSILLLDLNASDQISDQVILNHPCFMNSNTTTSWTFEGKDYLINGSDSGDCFNVTRRFIVGPGTEKTVHSPSELNERTIYAISYYFDRIEDIGFIKKPTEGTILKVEDYYTAAEVICSHDSERKGIWSWTDHPSRSSDNMSKSWKRNKDLFRRREELLAKYPFLCLDMSYIANLLTTGYGLSPKKNIYLMKKINGIETSWALGAAFNLLRL